MSNLETKIDEINRQGIPGQIWIDGSFLTEKLNPDDADIALFVSNSNFHALSPSQRRFFDDFRGASLYDQFKIDNYGIILDPSAPNSHWWHAYWLRQFGFSRSDELKGILLVSVPFLVTP
jgi:hypothetical protein